MVSELATKGLCDCVSTEEHNVKDILGKGGVVDKVVHLLKEKQEVEECS